MAGGKLLSNVEGLILSLNKPLDFESVIVLLLARNLEF